MIAKHQLDKSETWDGNFADLAANIDGTQHMRLWNPLLCSDCLDSCSYERFRPLHCTNCSHGTCGWLRELKDMASACIKEDLHLNLSDFPSRVERMELRSPLDFDNADIGQNVAKT